MKYIVYIVFIYLISYHTLSAMETIINKHTLEREQLIREATR